MKYLIFTCILGTAYMAFQHYNINIDRNFMFAAIVPLAYLFVMGVLFKN